MKIEKISDNQIRCTLHAPIWLTVSYSSVNWHTEPRKPNHFFRDMMQQAAFELV